MMNRISTKNCIGSRSYGKMFAHGDGNTVATKEI